MKQKRLLYLLLALAAVLTFYQLAKLFLWPKTSEAPASSASKVLLTVEPGDNMAKVARKLKDNLVISHERLFLFIAEFKGADRRIQPGEYEFDQGMSIMEVMDILVEGRQRYCRLLVPPGYNIWDVAAEIDKIWPGKAQHFLELCRDPRFIRSLSIDADSLEGYLFPDTYFVRRFDTVEMVARQMVGNFNRAWTPEFEQRAAALGYTRHQIVTIASIVEKETGLADEKPLVAAVIYNRLKLKMPLCMDPTVIYGMMPAFNGNLTRTNLITHTPYNTYQIRGLPPGPICNPGKFALRAALWPAQVNYLYFVSKGDGSHYFSSKYAEHLEAVRKYQHGGFEESQGRTVAPVPELMPGGSLKMNMEGL